MRWEPGGPATSRELRAPRGRPPAGLPIPRSHRPLTRGNTCERGSLPGIRSVHLEPVPGGAAEAAVRVVKGALSVIAPEPRSQTQPSNAPGGSAPGTLPPPPALAHHPWKESPEAPAARICNVDPGGLPQSRPFSQAPPTLSPVSHPRAWKGWFLFAWGGRRRACRTSLLPRPARDNWPKVSFFLSPSAPTQLAHNQKTIT